MHLMHQGLDTLVLQKVFVQIEAAKTVLPRFQNLCQLFGKFEAQVHLIKDDTTIDTDLAAQVLESLSLHGKRCDPKISGFSVKKALDFILSKGRQLVINDFTIIKKSVKGNHYRLLYVYNCRIHFFVIAVDFLEQSAHVGVVRLVNGLHHDALV